MLAITSEQKLHQFPLKNWQNQKFKSPHQIRQTPESKQRVYLYRIQSLIAPPPCLLVVLELMQVLFRRLNKMFLQIKSRKNPALNSGRCPNSNLSILTIRTTIAYQTCPLTLIHTILLSYLIRSLQLRSWISL